MDDELKKALRGSLIDALAERLIDPDELARIQQGKADVRKIIDEHPTLTATQKSLARQMYMDMSYAQVQSIIKMHSAGVPIEDVMAIQPVVTQTFDAVDKLAAEAMARFAAEDAAKAAAREADAFRIKNPGKVQRSESPLN